MALGLWGAEDDDPRALAEIRALGATHVSIVVSWRQRDVRATEIQGKIENSRPSVQNAVKEEWRNYRENRGKVGAKMNEVKGAGEETWRSATYEIETNLDSLEDTLDRVSKKL